MEDEAGVSIERIPEHRRSSTFEDVTQTISGVGMAIAEEEEEEDRDRVGLLRPTLDSPLTPVTRPVFLPDAPAMVPSPAPMSPAQTHHTVTAQSVPKSPALPSPITTKVHSKGSVTTSFEHAPSPVMAVTQPNLPSRAPRISLARSRSSGRMSRTTYI